MDGTLSAYKDMRETAQANTAACQVLRGQLDEANAALNAAHEATNYWIRQFNAVAGKLMEIQKVLK